MSYYFTVASIIGKNIRNKRVDSDMNQLQLGQRLNLSQRTISHFENGNIVPNSVYLKELARIFNCKTDDFYE